MEINNEKFICSLYESALGRVDGNLMRSAIDYALAGQGLCIKNNKLERKESPIPGYEYDEIQQKWALKIIKGVAYICTSNKDFPEGLFTVNQIYFSSADNVLQTNDKNKDWYFFDQKPLKDFRPWTINDAKHGDIIFLGGNKLVMYRTHFSKNAAEICVDPICYIVLTSYDATRFEKPEKGQAPLGYKTNAVRPATEEQKALFYKILLENGYVWDGTKKDIVCVSHLASFQNAINNRKNKKREEEIHQLRNQIMDLLTEHKCHLEIGTSKFGGDGIYVCACEKHPMDWDERLCNADDKRKQLPSRP